MAPTDSDIEEALACFAANDVPVLAAISHLIARIPRARLLELRLKNDRESAIEAMDLLEPFGSAIMLEAFVARPLDAAGAAADALLARLAAVRLTPRYDPWLVATILCGAARSLAALGRHAMAERLAREALAFMPTDPEVLVVLANSRENQGDRHFAATVRAYLRDSGYGAPIVTPQAPPEERDVVPYRP